jgi:hypothetical protein
MPSLSDEDLTVDIEALAEAHLKLPLDYSADLPANVLGETRFVSGKPPKIFLNRDLTGSAFDDDDASPGMVGRWRATLAHEIGHVLLHRYLFELDSMQRGLFSQSAQGQKTEAKLMRCLKRDVGYGGRGGSDWREVQANKAIGALLMPKPLIVGVLREERERRGITTRSPTASELQEIVVVIAGRFTASKQAAAIRIEGLLGASPKGQATLDS